MPSPAHDFVRCCVRDAAVKLIRSASNQDYTQASQDYLYRLTGIFASLVKIIRSPVGIIGRRGRIIGRRGRIIGRRGRIARCQDYPCMIAAGGLGKIIGAPCFSTIKRQ